MYNHYRIIFVTHSNDTGGHQPDTLQEVNVLIWTNEACRSKYGPSAPGGIVEHFLCAGDNGHDSCSVSLLQICYSHLIISHSDQLTTAKIGLMGL